MNKTSIAWFDLTFKIHSIFTRNEKIILNKLNGSAEFGTLTAVMGPSGAGLTSLLKCLNGMNNSMLDSATKIRLSSVQKIRTSFVGYNEKEFLIMGLTAKQNMIYASKLKNSNCNEDIDHERNISQIMSDLLISDIMNTRAENCSGGEQKRLAIALELTALKKPNLMFCDEPTTGLDSNIAEIVFQCLKELSLKHNISIITTIHQPNSDILQMIDKLYVLAKGGVCVYWGTPQNLSNHMRSCDIICNAYQVPIENLVKISAKGIEDQEICRLRDKTISDSNELNENIIFETKSKQIGNKNKSFNFKDIILLLSRAFTEFYFYEWKIYLFKFLIVFMSSLAITIAFDKYVGKSNDCFGLGTVDNRSCLQMLESDKSTEHNVNLIFLLIWMSQIAQCVISCSGLSSKFMVFRNEHQNKWYSSGSYFVSQTIRDLIPTTINGLFFCFMYLLSHQPNQSKRLWAFVYSNILSLHITESIAYICVVIIKDKQIAMLVSFTFITTGCSVSGFAVRITDLSNLLEFYSHFTSMKFVLNSALISVYGMDRCSQNQTSRVLLEYGLGDDDFGKNTLYAWIQILSYRGIALFVLLSFKNSKYYEFIINYFRTKFLNERNFNEFEIKSIVLSDQRREYYENQISVEDFEEELSSDSNSSVYYSICENECQLFEEFDSNNSLCIAWIDMTLKVEKTFYSNGKLILRAINGFINFGTLTALMGPSGAGKTSLLKCLNGMYRNLMTKESKIYLSKWHKIRTCFIAQDQREHILKGLTVKQSLLYASKLKNIGIDIDHKSNIKQLMEELAIIDIKKISVDKCSFGQQKRIVMAMELTPKIKPNLICVDEPTSGVDSYSAFLMIKCFKRVSQKHNLSIITSIHQPNLEILMKFDLLYVLAKGGVTIFSGRPQQLRNHLKECEINITENQIPIEVVLKIAANGCNDQNIIKMSDKTEENLKPFYSRVDTELKHFPNGIPLRRKKFSYKELKPLLMRTIAYILGYKWILMVGLFILYVFFCALVRLAFRDMDLENAESCIDLSFNASNGCLRSEEQLKQLKYLQYHLFFLTVTFLIPAIIDIFAYSQSIALEMKIFQTEYRNHWYSSESYYLIKSFIDLIQCIINIILISLVFNFYERDDMFGPILLSVSLLAIAAQALGQVVGICCGQYQNIFCVIAMVWHLIFTNTLVPSQEHRIKFLRKAIEFDLTGWQTRYLIYSFYEKRCSINQISTVFYRYSIVRDDLNKSLTLMIFIIIFFKILSYISLKLKVFRL